MTKKEVRKVVKQSILDGKTKQETFETLKETAKLPTEDLAKIIQSIPSLQARQKYKTLNMILIGLLSLTVLFKMMAGIPIIIENGIKWFPVLFILPIINILLLIGVATYSQSSHKWVAIFTILGLLRSLSDILGQPFEPLIIIDLTIAAGLIGLGFYLNSKLCPDYLTVKERYQNNQGQDRLRNVIKFND
jgi:predicted RNase H-like HicB family nuclease